MSVVEVELASSWSLRQHYSENLHSRAIPSRPMAPGRHGIAICNGSIDVYDDLALLDKRPREARRSTPRSMCKRCERLAAGDGYQVRQAGDER